MPGMRVSFSVFSLYILGFQPLARALIAANTAQATLAQREMQLSETKREPDSEVGRVNWTSPFCLLSHKYQRG